MALKLFGALAAAQLALSGATEGLWSASQKLLERLWAEECLTNLHPAGAAMADLIPETIKSQSARDELNKRTSNLPSLGGVAKSFGQSSCKLLAVISLLLVESCLEFWAQKPLFAAHPCSSEAKKRQIMQLACI